MDTTPVTEGVSVFISGSEKMIPYMVKDISELNENRRDWFESWCGLNIHDGCQHGGKFYEK